VERDDLFSSFAASVIRMSAKVRWPIFRASPETSGRAWPATWCTAAQGQVATMRAQAR
jgi:hypothetical protein